MQTHHSQLSLKKKKTLFDITTNPCRVPSSLVLKHGDIGCIRKCEHAIATSSLGLCINITFCVKIVKIPLWANGGISANLNQDFGSSVLLARLISVGKIRCPITAAKCCTIDLTPTWKINTGYSSWRKSAHGRLMESYQVLHCRNGRYSWKLLACSLTC